MYDNVKHFLTYWAYKRQLLSHSEAVFYHLFHIGIIDVCYAVLCKYTQWDKGPLSVSRNDLFNKAESDKKTFLGYYKILQEDSKKCLKTGHGHLTSNWRQHKERLTSVAICTTIKLLLHLVSYCIALSVPTTAYNNWWNERIRASVICWYVWQTDRQIM